ncbi:MAG: serine/threonine protein kinase [Deltaproteobacteria bacterium]|nr:serine/threonine protein kinase [Deltaproteobacteria bacterium]
MTGAEMAIAAVRRGAPGTTSATLPADLVAAGNRRLVLALALYAAGATLSQIVHTLAHLYLGAPRPPGGFAVQWGIAAAVAVFAAVVARLLRRGSWSVDRHAALPVVVQAVGTAAIVGAELAGGVGEHTTGLSRAVVWLVVFPVLVPRSTRAAAVGSGISLLVAASALAVAAALTPRLPPAGELFLWLAPFVVAATLGVAVSRVVHGLGREVARARQMGSYRLLSRIGAGGMGEVWRAEHRLLARPAAVKLVHADRYARRDGDLDLALRRFEREAKATASLRSPHTVALFDFGVTEEGSLYYAMELLEGMDAETLVERFGPVDAARAVHLLRQVCSSLAEAHAAGLVHRDIKPANIHVGRAGVEHDFVKVLDFGLVRPALDSGEMRLTADGTMSGTPAYMAPEVITGRAEVDARADLYAVGCVAYWLLTGQCVFEGRDAMAVVIQHATAQPVPPSLRTELPIPAELESLVMSLLAKEPDARPASAMDVVARLDAIHLSSRWDAADAAAWWQSHRALDARPDAPAHRSC